MYLTHFTSLAWAYELRTTISVFARIAAGRRGFATCQRKGVFTSALGKALSDYWLRVAAMRAFAIDQISVIPDHVHLLVRIMPRMSIQECALLLMNNGQHFIGKDYPQVLV
ncbi:MAG: transposase, partial [Pyrinomonadaceae bacterium]